MPLNPASSIKLLTTYAGLLQLGPDYTWKTAFHLDGSLTDGVLDGDLVMVGGGDPKLVIEDLEVIIGQLRARGLTTIAGDLRLNNALYARPLEPRDAIDGLLTEPYNVWPDAAMLNFKSTKFVVTPGRRGAQLELDPPLAGVRLENRISQVKGKCRHRASGLKIRERAGKTGAVIRVGGRFSARCGQSEAFHAVLNHVTFSDALFRAAWTAAGGTWKGKAVRERRSLSQITEQTGGPWYVWQSPRPMAQIITDINKFSNNVMTRQLMLQLAAENQEERVDEASGRRLVEAILRLNGLGLQGLVLDNGSGLSRQARISARGLTDVLLHASRGPHADTFRESLPIVGVDGTMRRQLRSHPIAGHAWIKTGSLAGVRSMAGYVAAQSGAEYVVSLIVNGPGARASYTVQNQLLQWLFKNG